MSFLGSMRRAVVGSIITIAFSGLAQSTEPSKVTLKQLAFISGHWKGELEGAVTDDFWSGSEGDTIIGMYREVKDGAVTMYELETIEQTKQGPILLLKHFNRGLKGWEEKDQVWSYPLISWKENEAIFERPDKGTRLTFRRTGKDTLETTLDELKDGKTVTLRFHEKRVEWNR